MFDYIFPHCPPQSSFGSFPLSVPLFSFPCINPQTLLDPFHPISLICLRFPPISSIVQLQVHPTCFTSICMVLVLHSCYLNVYMDPLPSYPLPTSSLSSLLSSSNHQEQAAVLTTQSPVFLFEKNSIFSMCILIVLNKNGCCFWCLRVSAKLRNKSKVSDTLFHV